MFLKGFSIRGVKTWDYVVKSFRKRLIDLYVKGKVYDHESTGLSISHLSACDVK